LIIGQSGSGKTVLLKSFGNTYSESGQICFDGRVYSELNPDENGIYELKSDGIQGVLFDSMTVAENVGFL
jgi:phospholipid/cholesterol/gamma-HCH transport system ATP-binding protein